VIGSNVGEIERTAHDLAQEARSVFTGETRVPMERTMWAAAALIVLGAVLLVGNITGIAFGRLWPVLLILLGAVMIYQAAQRR
jgi:hypothetical protein